MAVLKYWLLLVVFNVLIIVHVKLECELDGLVGHRSDIYYCDIGNVTIYVDHDDLIQRTKLDFVCEGTNVTFPTLPENAGNNYSVVLHVDSCPISDVLRFVNELYDEPTIAEAEISITNELTSRTDMDNFKNTSILSLISDAETTIFINASFSWSALKVLEIEGENNLQFIYNDTEVNMTKLQTDSLSCLKSLEKFHIQDNKNIEIIGTDALRGFNQLQVLNLFHGKLKYIEAGAFSNTSLLKSLDLSYNMLESIAKGLFQNLESIVEIFLQGNQLKAIDSHTFAHILTLKIIDISNCTITSLSKNVFSGSDNIEILKVHQNKLESLPSKIFQNQQSLNTLNLGYNRFKDPRNFNVFNSLKNLEYLDLSNNQIKILPKSLFVVSTKLREIDLSNNIIDSLDKELVHDIRDHEIVYETIKKSSESEPFEYFTKLKRLNLAGNKIVSGSLPWNLLIHLKYLDFSRNQINEMYSFNEDFTELDIVIDLSYNQLRYLDLSTDGLTSSRGANSSVILTGNPIECDCRNYGLYNRLNGFHRPGEPKFFLHSNCTSPSHLKRSLINISPELLTCNFTNEICFELSCNSCIIIKNKINLNCQKQPWENKISAHFFCWRITESISIHFGRSYYQPSCSEDFIKLNLSNTGIQSLTLVPDNLLNSLDVTRNNLSTIPDVFLKNNYSLYLSNNPFVCKCEFVKNIFALYERGLLPDYNEMTCANGDKVAQIDINELCNRSIRLISLIGCSTIGSFVALVTVIKLYLNAHNIWMSFLKIFCKRKYERSRIEMREIGIETAKVYDLFISYAHQDENFVAETLLPKLENEFNQKVCVHTRDWVVGNVIANQIIESVEKSRRTVIILSEHFLMSEWSEVEFHTAHNWSLQEGKPRIIIIVLKDEVVRDDRMGAELKSYIARNTYLLWGDPLFWEKLQKILPGKIPKYIW